MPQPVPHVNGDDDRGLPPLPVSPAVPVLEPTVAHTDAEGRGLIVRLERRQGLTDPTVLGRPFVFQVPPLDSLPINRSFPHTDYDTVNADQRSRPGSAQLKSVSFRTFFTEDIARWTLLHGSGFRPDPIRMLDELEDIGLAKTPFWLTVRNQRRGSRFDIAMLATLRDVNSEEVHGEPDTRYVTVAFSEYRPTMVGARRRVGGRGSGWVPSENPRGSRLPVSVLTSNLPEGGNTLFDLARIYYGDPTEWRRIASANGLTIPPSYDLNLLTNRKLLLPRRL